MAFERLKRGFGAARSAVGQAFDMRGDSTIRNQTDEDETAENLDYMSSRGKSRQVANQNAAAGEEAGKVRRRMYGFPQAAAEGARQAVESRRFSIKDQPLVSAVSSFRKKKKPAAGSSIADESGEQEKY